MKPKVVLSTEWMQQFCETHHICKLALFGSVLTDHFSDSSDVDVLVEFDDQCEPGFFDFAIMKDELMQYIGREVDLRTPEDISQRFRKEALDNSYLRLVKQGITALFGILSSRTFPFLSKF